MFHKEFIRDRMLKEIARSWNINGYVNEDSFDPLVNMLVTALSSESELIYKEMGRSQDRVAGSLMSKLIPYVNKGVLPGHTMALLSPAEPFVELPEHTSLVTQIRWGNFDLKEVRFLTCSRVPLFNGGIVAMSSALKQYEIADYRFKVEKDVDEDKKSDLKDTQIKLEVSFQGDSFNNDTLPLFFDLRLTGDKRRIFYEKLARASFAINSIPVSKINRSVCDEILSETDNPLVSLENSVSEFYRYQYFQLEIPAVLKMNEGFKKSKVEENSSFNVVIEFGDFVDAEIIQELFCFVNVVPLINIQEHERIFKTKNDFSVFHLSQQDPFYCIKSVRSDDGKVYHKYDGARSGKEVDGSFLLRKEEVEGLSEKGAGEIIDYLIGIMRNENAVLSNITGGNFSNDLKVLKQITSRLAQAMSGRKSYEDSTYIFLKDDNVPEFVFVEYYTTKGNEVKGLKINSPLFAQDGCLLRQNGNFVLTPLTGARNALKEDEFLYDVRHAMLSGGRIVTKRDIFSLVQKYYRENIGDLKVLKGMMECTDVKRGYVRTVDVRLQTKAQMSFEDCSSNGKLLLCELEEKGSDIYPYRLFIDDKEIIK